MGVFGLLAVVALFVVAGIAISSKIGGHREGANGAITRNAPAVQTVAPEPVPQFPPSNSDDWYRAVCRLGTITPRGNELLRGAIAGDSCVAGDGPILIGKYTSTLARDNDLAMFYGRQHDATMADDQGYIWLFVALTPRASAALQSLRQFGFLVN